jgi:hypothetical protein
MSSDLIKRRKYFNYLLIIGAILCVLNEALYFNLEIFFPQIQIFIMVFILIIGFCGRKGKNNALSGAFILFSSFAVLVVIFTTIIEFVTSSRG